MYIKVYIKVFKKKNFLKEKNSGGELKFYLLNPLN
jgi:hypothetical protein